MRRGDEVSEQVLSRPGRYQVLAETLEVKEVVVGDGEGRRRYTLCYNAQEAGRQRGHRAQLLEQLRPNLSRSRRVAATATASGCARYARALACGRYLKLDG